MFVSLNTSSYKFYFTVVIFFLVENNILGFASHSLLPRWCSYSGGEGEGSTLPEEYSVW